MQKIPSSRRLEALCKVIENSVLKAQAFEEKNKKNLCYPEYAGCLQSSLDIILTTAYALREDPKKNKVKCF